MSRAAQTLLCSCSGGVADPPKPPSLQQGENRQKMLMLRPGLSAAAPVGMEQQRLARKESNGKERMELRILLLGNQ